MVVILVSSIVLRASRSLVVVTIPIVAIIIVARFAISVVVVVNWSITTNYFAHGNRMPDRITSSTTCCLIC